MNDCVFCQIVDKRTPSHIVYEDADYLAFLDKYPQTHGHLQLIPKTHVRWVYDIPDIGQFFTVTQRIIHVIIPVLGATHVTIGTFGREIEHAHLWIVPQYRVDRTMKEGIGQEINKQSLQEVAAILRTALKGA